MLNKGGERSIQLSYGDVALVYHEFLSALFALGNL